jgi:hypothetical protein
MNSILTKEALRPADLLYCRPKIINAPHCESALLSLPAEIHHYSASKGTQQPSRSREINDNFQQRNSEIN